MIKKSIKVRDFVNNSRLSAKSYAAKLLKDVLVTVLLSDTC